MPAFDYLRESLLAPISQDHPCGLDLRHDRTFSEILDARRADDQLAQGEWEKKDPKVADWERVAELCLSALETRTKDLRLAAFVTEAALRLDGFEGFGSGVKLCRELLVRYWDQGIFPLIEDGDLDYRAASLSPLNDLLPFALRQLPLIARSDAEGYTFVRFQQSQHLATETKPDTIADLKRQGYITLETFRGVLKSAALAELEPAFNQIVAAEANLLELRNSADQKFGEAAPSFVNVRTTLSEIRELLEPVVKSKRKEAAAAGNEGNEGGDKPNSSGTQPESQRVESMAGLTTGLPADQSGSWSEAEALIQQGKVDQGLAWMATLAANEASGRARFLRKLMLVDVCLRTGRDRLAKTILEELKEQIVQFKLGLWESSALVGAVWSRLYKIYRKSERSGEQEMAAALYTQLCQLDPWQAYLHCED